MEKSRRGVAHAVTPQQGRAAGSERKSGGFVRWTGRRQTRLNALIPREAKVPEGSGDRGRGRPNRVVEVQRATGSETAATGAIRHAVVEPKGRTGTTSVLGRKRSSRLGALTPEWRTPRGGSRCGRAKSRYERPVPGRRRQAASQEALIRGLEKTAHGERRGESSGALVCEAQCRACR